jgi:DNA-binding MarR family transcriptional regulator
VSAVKIHSNVRDAVRKHRHAAGERSPRAKVTDVQVRAMRALHADGFSQREIAAAFALDQSTVSLTVRGLRRKGG